MSFRWKGLLGVGGNNNATSASTSLASGLSGGNHANLKDPFDEQEWANHSFDPLDVPNVLGMENFGNTCYMNSVMQALYFCDPFRESVLAYTSAALLNTPSTPTINNIGLSNHSNLESPPQDEESLFSALRMLFQNMASASLKKESLNNLPQADSQSQTSSNSFMGTGLSRKVSSRPNTASSKYGSTGGVSSSNTNANVHQTSSNTDIVMPQPNANTCSNIVVSDSDIKTFLSSLKKSNILFDSTAHQDAHELLNFVLNRIGEDIIDEAKSNQGQWNTPIHDLGPDRKTMVHKLFEGILTNETRCLTCESITSRDECFLDLSLDIERNSSVTSCLRQFSASEMLSSRNKFFCDTCSGLQEAEKRMKIKKLPNVLALHLKRFKYEESVQRFVKLAYRVVFPMQLRLFNTSDDAEDPDKLYELYGFIVHIGIGPHHGHYIAIIKIDKRWFVFDDETISVIDESDISRYFGDTPGAGSAYVLFYQAVELDMQSLGLPNVKAMRAEKARIRREESVKKRLQLYSSNSTANTMQRSSSAHAAPSSLFSLGTLGLPNNSTSPMSAGDLTPVETPSRTTTPAEGRSGLFGRFQNSTGNATSSNAPPANNVTNANLLPVSPTTTEQSESRSSSWLTSLRTRKPSANLAMPLTQSPPLLSKKPLFPDPSTITMGNDGAEGGDDKESVSASSSNNLPEEDSIPFQKYSDRQRSPMRGETLLDRRASERHTTSPRRATLSGSLSSNNSPSKSPVRQATPGQGAIFKPAERPLSKKEQEKIAKAARRNTSINISTAHIQQTIIPATASPPATPLPSLSTMPSIVSNTNGTSVQSNVLDDNENLAPPNPNSISGWRKVTMPRRPTTADESIDPSTSTAQRRRSTLSRTFGFGRKDKNGS